MSSNDSTKKMMIVALGVCLVCSVLVSTAAVSLSKKQEINRELDKVRNILVAGDLMQPDGDFQQIFRERIEPMVVDMTTGNILSEDEYPEELDPRAFDVQEAAESSVLGMTIPSDQDVADINRMPKYMTVYRVMSGDSVSQYILPLYGRGLWSTMYGFLALGPTFNTVKGITFYDHGETPGLGGEIDNPEWKAIWEGKKVFDDQGNVGITVVKGNVDPTDPRSQYKVDGLSGSTLTTRGLDSMVEFWLGEYGYGPFFENIREERSDEQG